MKTEVLSLNEDTIRFLLAGVDTAFANALRRTMFSEVPIMTVDDIFYFDNSSLVPDEVLAHRVGLVPLKTDLDSYILPEDCDCDNELGCPKCRAILTMDIETTEETITVYSGDLIPEDPATGPASKKIPLAKIAPGQAIRFEAYAQLGKGNVHSKWSPTSMCVYQNVAVVPIKDMAAVELCLETCGDAARVEDGVLKVIDLMAFEKCDRCREVVSHKELLSSLKPDEFLFTVESNGALPPQRIVTEAVKILKAKLSTLVEKVSNDDLHDEISDFTGPEFEETKLYTVGSGDYDEDEEEEFGGEFENE